MCHLLVLFLSVIRFISSNPPSIQSNLCKFRVWPAQFPLKTLQQLFIFFNMTVVGNMGLYTPHSLAHQQSLRAPRLTLWKSLACRVTRFCHAVKALQDLAFPISFQYIFHRKKTRWNIINIIFLYLFYICDNQTMAWLNDTLKETGRPPRQCEPRAHPPDTSPDGCFWEESIFFFFLFREGEKNF